MLHIAVEQTRLNTRLSVCSTPIFTQSWRFSSSLCFVLHHEQIMMHLACPSWKSHSSLPYARITIYGHSRLFFTLPQDFYLTLLLIM